MVRNAAEEVESNIRKINTTVKPESGFRYLRKLVSMLGGNSSIQIVVLGIIFQYEE